MVVITEPARMFWGLSIDSGKHYTQTVERGFHLSMAALENNPNVEGKKSHVAVMIGHEKAEFLLCSLDQVRVPQQPLDLNFVEGEEVTFFLNGNGHVHLTGYLVDDEFGDDALDESFDPDMAAVSEEDMSADSDNDTDDSDEDEDSDEEEEDDDSEEEAPMLLPLEGPKFDESDEDSDDDEEEEEEVVMSGKRKKQAAKQPKKKAKQESSEEEDESDEINLSGSFLQENSKAKQGDKSPSKSQPGTPQTNGQSSKKKNKKKKAKEIGQGDHKSQPNTPGQGKKQKSQPNTPAQKEGESKKGQTPGKKEGEKKGTPGTGKKEGEKKGTPGTGKKASKRIMEGNVIAEEVKEGHGPEAKPGRTVALYYTGKLQNGKAFDSCSSGKPFKFKLGKNEVIKGWDIGVKGMKVGGKRKITIPSKMAYGSQSMSGIPANSTLLFDLELKSVS